MQSEESFFLGHTDSQIRLKVLPKEKKRKTTS